MALLENDWAFLTATVPDLQGYLLSAQLYWPLTLNQKIGKRRESASLTPGNLLLALKRLRASTMDVAKSDELEILGNQVDYIRERWRSNWMQKCAKEFPSRFRLWEGYLRDLSEDVGIHSTEYHHDVRWRAILHLLKGEMESLPDGEADHLNMLDITLRSLASRASFVWEIDLAGGFPEEIYWFLYLSFPNQKIRGDLIA